MNPVKQSAKKKVELKTYIALKNLATEDRQVKIGDEFKCTDAEYQTFKKAKAVK